MHDRFRNRYRVAAASTRLRRQIALEAARRLYRTLVREGESRPENWPDAADASELYVAKRKAAAVLGHRVRPGDLPSDAEVREQLVVLDRCASGVSGPEDPMPEPESASHGSLAEQLDRFAIYKMRLEPLESIKQNPKSHPEGDALFHSLQVFHLARDVRPYDEEFLLAALLHDVGKAIDPQNHEAAGVEALRGAVTERTLWLIEHHTDLLSARTQPLSARMKRELDASEHAEDLALLCEFDLAGRVPGQHVDSIAEVLEYLKGLEDESYLEKPARANRHSGSCEDV
jgi:HD domain